MVSVCSYHNSNKLKKNSHHIQQFELCIGLELWINYKRNPKCLTCVLDCALIWWASAWSLGVIGSNPVTPLKLLFSGHIYIMEGK